MAHRRIYLFHQCRKIESNCLGIGNVQSIRAALALLDWILVTSNNRFRFRFIRFTIDPYDIYPRNSDKVFTSNTFLILTAYFLVYILMLSESDFGEVQVFAHKGCCLSVRYVFDCGISKLKVWQLISTQWQNNSLLIYMLNCRPIQIFSCNYSTNAMWFESTLI